MGTIMMQANPNPYHTTDIDLLKARLQLTPSQRLKAMFDAREMIFALKRGHLRQQFPQLSEGELNLKILEEIDRVRNLPARPLSIS